MPAIESRFVQVLPWQFTRVSLIYIQICLLYLLLCVHDEYSAPNRYPFCTVQSVVNESKNIIGVMPGHFLIAGLFDVHDHYNPITEEIQSINPRNLQRMQSMIYAIDAINKNSSLLPNITLGWYLLDTRGSVPIALADAIHVMEHNNIRHSDKYIKSCSCSQDIFGAPWIINATNTTNITLDKQIIGVIGTRSSKESIATSTLLSAYNVPQISYASTSRALSDNIKFRTFFRTVPSDVYQAQAIIDIIRYFQWNYFAIVTIDDQYGSLLRSEVVNLAAKYQICAPINAVFPSQFDRQIISDIVTRLVDSVKVKAIVLICSEAEADAFFQQAQNQNLIGRIWIGSDAWGGSPTIAEKYPTIVAGMIGVTLLQAIEPLYDFYQYLKTLNLCNNNRNPWFNEYWIQLLSKNSASHTLSKDILLKCDEMENLSDNYTTKFYTNSVGSAYVMDGVYALAHALHKVLNCNHQFCPFDNYDDQSLLDDILEKLKSIHFNGYSESPFEFDSNGDGRPKYAISQLQYKEDDNNVVKQHLQFESIGTWKDSKSATKSNLTIWEKKLSRDLLFESYCSENCQPGTRRLVNTASQCCWQCLPCDSHQISTKINSQTCNHCKRGYLPNQNRTECIEIPVKVGKLTDTLPLAVLITNGISFVLTISIWIVIFKNRSKPIVKAANVTLIYLLLFSIALCHTSPIVFMLSKTAANCSLVFSAIILPMVYIAIILMNKTHIIVVLFKSSSFHRQLSYWNRGIGQFSIIIVEFVTTTLVFMIIKFVDPASVEKRFSADETPYYHCNTKYQFGTYLAMAILLIITTASAYFAFKARHIPARFHEAKYIFLTSLLFCIFILIYIPTIIFISGPMQSFIGAFGMIALAASVQLCLFSNKIYTIFFDPQANDIQATMIEISNYTFNRVSKQKNTT